MPGVPSSRACDACRKQRKRAKSDYLRNGYQCDLSKPSCSRCSRLRIVCIGSGQQRYKFKEDARSFHALARPEADPEWKHPHWLRTETITTQMVQISRIRSNEKTLLANALIEKLTPSEDLRYQLAWTFGDLLAHIPRRIGSNQALDASVAALIAAHSHFSTPLDCSATYKSLVTYSHALKALRACLDNPVTALESNTVCAVMLLLICQSFNGPHQGMWTGSTGHGQGAAQILKARGHYDTRDEFERILFRTLSTAVLFEALVNPSISFSPEEWKTIVGNELVSTNHPGGRMIQCLSYIPSIMQRVRVAIEERNSLNDLVAETRIQYRIAKTTLVALQGLLYADPDQINAWTPATASSKLIHAHYQRLYSTGLTITIVLNCILKAISGSDGDLVVESTHFCKDVLLLAEAAAIYRPLGSSYMIVCLVAAWCNTSDEGSKANVEDMLCEYWSAFVGQDTQVPRKELERTSQLLSSLQLQKG
ncbi:hypothetical protein M501DRAFT_941160 [Patellaria atrata CBS 101060]|uniref:Zn(2)-C6 fungal-type domain-containing protein n=1 Tax=Patellaria atrata CBS 101060 TaxID=1346257 RepID=A0A9P4S648_9PEZI|nr:hypothetical protein M501DRAFT_941160 [Patellaria atrata CBS 101060]